MISALVYGNDAEFLYDKNFNVICVDKSETSKQYINEKNKNIKVIVEQFESMNFDNYDLVYSNLGIVFCNKNYIDELIIKIKKSIKNYGFFVGNFLGDSDDWNNEKNSNMKFFSVNDIKEKFKDFKIFYIAEKKYIKDSSKEKDKHWHIIEIYAQKIPN